jgi:hypothetical protein
MRENHDSARPALGTDPLPRRFQDIPPKDPVIQDLEPELRLQLGLTAQFPSPQGDFQGQTGLRFKPFFRNGTSAQAGFPPLMKTRSKSCPLAPRGLTAAALLWAGPTPGRNGQAGDGFPTPPWVRATGCPTRSAGSPRFPSGSLDTCRLQPPRTARRHAPVIPWRRWQASPSVGRVAAVGKSNEAESSSLALRPASRLGPEDLDRLA